MDWATGRAHDRRPEVSGHADHHHVAFDEFPEMNAGVETGGDEIDRALVARHVEYDVGVVACEWSKPGCEYRRCGERRHHQTHASRRPVAQAGNQVECKGAGSGTPQTQRNNYVRDCPGVPVRK
jgi:hypothetical protein